MDPILIVISFLLLLIIVLQIALRPKANNKTDEVQLKLNELQNTLLKIESNLKDDFRINRQENAEEAKRNRDELNASLKEHSSLTTDRLDKITLKIEEKLSNINKQFKDDNQLGRESLEKASLSFSEVFDKNVQSFNNLQKEKFGLMESRQNELVSSTEKKLETIRVTVEEKLDKTLGDRLNQSFETVGKQLIEVQKGLGEMQTLAQDVGGLKRVLSNVKMRGGLGEVQLAMLLEQVLSPGQYQQNVRTKSGSNDAVEFAIKLPGNGEAARHVWLPIDAKFPKDHYEKLQDAYDSADPDEIGRAQRLLEAAIRKMAKDINEKYLNPPNTTDFAIMFLPFEGIYAEVVRKASLLEDLQRNCKVIITGPTTLAAILNSLQMGFKTLAIQKRSSEVWQVLGAVKKEFENFGGILQKAQHNIQTGLGQLDDVMGKRTRAIQRKLKSVESISEEESQRLLASAEDFDDGEQ